MTERGPNRLENVAFAVLATLALALLGVFLALLAGLVPLAEPGGTAEEPPAAAAATTTTTSAARTAEPEPEPEAEAEERPGTTAARSSVGRVVVSLVASRGDCWVLARRGGPDGEVLHEALLPAGERITLRAARVWLQLGAAANVDVAVDGDPVAIGAGTVELVLPATDAGS